MGQRERIVLWVLVAVLLVGQGIAAVLLSGEIAALRTQVEILAGARPSATEELVALPTLAPNVGAVDTGRATLRVRALGVSQPLSATALITVAVRGSGAADPLLDLPVLDCDGLAYPVDGASLELARQDLLALITRGEATTALLFYGAPDLSQACTLLLNPEQPVTSLIAPPLTVPVPRLAATNEEANEQSDSVEP